MVPDNPMKSIRKWPGFHLIYFFIKINIAINLPCLHIGPIVHKSVNLAQNTLDAFNQHHPLSSPLDCKC